MDTNELGDAIPVNRPDSIHLDHHGKHYTIEPTPVNIAHKTLGHYKSPDLNRTRSIQQIKDIGNLFYRFLTNLRITTNQTDTSYQTKYRASMRHVLQVSSFTDNELEPLDRQLRQILLPKLGYKIK